MTDTPRCEPPEHLRGVDGWHWVKIGHGHVAIALWRAAPRPGIEPLWRSCWGTDTATPAWAAEHWGYRYIAPVLPPADADALRAERDAMEQQMLHEHQAAVDQYSENARLLGVIGEAIRCIGDGCEDEADRFLRAAMRRPI